MIKKNYKDVHFINKGTQVIDKIYKDNQLVFEQGYTREQEEVPPLTTTYKSLGKDLKDYKIYGNTILRVLPEEYQEVEYIRSTGTQYIDTGIKPTATMKWVLDNEFSRAPVDPYYYNGLYDGNSLAVRRVDIGMTTSYLYLNFGANNSIASYVGFVNSRYVYTVDAKNMKWSYDATTGDIPEATYKTSPLNIFLFARNENGTANRFSYQKTYSSKIYDDDVLVQNLVPCYRKSDNKPGMYDTVTNTFFTNSGTGTDFTVGPDVASSAPTTLAPVEVESVGDYISPNGLPEEYQEVEYIGSTGTQYIDTGRIPNATDIIEQKFRRNDTNKNTCAWYGSMPTASTVVPRIGLGVSSGGWFVGVNSTNYYLSEIDTNVHTLKFWYTSNRSMEYILDGVESRIYQANGTQDVEFSLTSYLFARHGRDGVQVNDGEGTNIYYHKEYLADGTLQMSLVPCVRKLDNKPGMYDTVTGTFFTNQGTGEFTVGHSMTLPDGYKELEYIESTGTQYITVPDELNLNCKYELEMSIDDVDYGTTPFFGVFGHFSASIRYQVYLPVSNMAFSYSFRDGFVNTGTIATKEQKYKIELSNDGLKIDDILVSSSVGSNTEPTETYNIFNLNGSVSRVAYMKLYSFKSYENDTLTRNFIPCIRKSDGKVGLYDLVTNTFFANQGTGEFIAGPTIKKYVVPVTVSGKNLWNQEIINGDQIIQNLKVGATYTVTADADNDTSYMYVRSRSGSNAFSRIGMPVAAGTRYPTTFTVEAGKDYSLWSNATYTHITDVQIEEGSTATEYQPYVEPTTEYIYIDEPLRKSGDVADYIDFKNQKVVRNLAEADLGTLTWSYSSATNRMYTASASTIVKPVSAVTVVANILSDIYRLDSVNNSASSSGADYTISVGTNSYLYVRDSRYTDPAQFKTAMGGKQVVYELATPIEEPTELPVLPTLKGTTIYEVGTKVQPSNMYIKYKSR